MKRKKRKGKEYKGKNRNNSKKTLSLSLTMQTENGRSMKGIIGDGGTMKNTLHQTTYKVFLSHEQSKNLHHFH